MFKIASIVLLSCVFSLLYASPAFATEDFTFSITSLSEFEIGQFPFVNGKAITLDNSPVSDVQIQINFPSGAIRTTTNSTGQFSALSPAPTEIGEYTITVYAKKDNRYTNSLITYQGVESKPKIESQIEKTPKINEKIELDPFSKMLKDIEEQKIEEVERKTNVQEQHKVDEQRRLAQIDIQKDLKESEKRNESHSSRNIFYKFIQEVDSSVRGIFWQQFLFTEKITKQAQNAKENALNEGKSSFEAMKIFQEEASVTQKEVMEFNKYLSIQYGQATNSTQSQFDENGKIPREE